MAMKRIFLQVIALLLGAISLVNCSGSPSCVLISTAATPVRALGRAPAAVGANGCPVGTGGGGGGNGTCSNTLTPADVLFGQAATGAITTLAINTPVGTNLSLMCTTANAGLGEIAVANVTATNKNFLYALSISGQTVTIDGFAIGHVAPVTLSAVGPAFTFLGTKTFTSVEMQADPSGRFLTVADEANSLVHVLLIDSNLNPGALTEAPGSPFTVANALFTAAAVNGAGEFLYVTDNVDGLIFMFSVNVSASPVLTPLASPSFLASGGVSANSPISMLVNSTATLLYTANNQSISIFAISAFDGSLGAAAGIGSPVTPAPAFNPQLLAMDFTNSFLYASGEGTEGVLGYTVNPDGSLTVLNGGTPFASGLAGGVTDIVADPALSIVYLLINGVINPYTISTTIPGNLNAPTVAPTFTASTNLAAAFVQ
jgi:hypothetical protein